MRIIWRNSYMWTGIWPYRQRQALEFYIPGAWWLHWKWLEFCNWYNLTWSAQQAQIAFFQAGGEDMSDARWTNYLSDDLNMREFLALMICMNRGDNVSEAAATDSDDE